MEVVRLAEETVLKTAGGNTFAGSIPVTSAVGYMKYIDKHSHLLEHYIHGSLDTMNSYEIWMEGFLFSGEDERATASFVGTSQGVNFRDAVISWYKSHPERLSTFNEEYLTDWGCRLFPTEEEARRSFG